MDLGDKIKQARSAKGLTQKELAIQTGLTERTIQRIENHEVEPSVYSLAKISERLEADFSSEKHKILKRRNRILYVIAAVWTLALFLNMALGKFELASRWWELILWLIVLVGIMTKQIYFPYRRRKSA